MRSGTSEANGKPSKQAEDGQEGKSDRDVGNALRRAYDEAVGEAIPDDLLDLLKKLD